MHALEQEFASFIGVKRFVSVDNGLEAQELMLRAEFELGRISAYDVLMMPANTYVATILAITPAGLVPRLIETSLETFNLDATKVEVQLDDRFRVILTVHLYGRIGFDEKLNSIVERNGLRL